MQMDFMASRFASFSFASSDKAARSISSPGLGRHWAKSLFEI